LDKFDDSFEEDDFNLLVEEDLFLTIVLVVFLDETFLAGEGIFSAIFLTARACLPELEGATFDLLEVLVETDFFAVAFLLSAFGLETLLLLEDLACLGLAAFELVLVAIFLALMGIKFGRIMGQPNLARTSAQRGETSPQGST